jgi:hypothetical protein
VGTPVPTRTPEPAARSPEPENGRVGTPVPTRTPEPAARSPEPAR